MLLLKEKEVNNSNRALLSSNPANGEQITDCVPCTRMPRLSFCPHFLERFRKGHILVCFVFYVFNSAPICKSEVEVFAIRQIVF